MANGSRASACGLSPAPCCWPRSRVSLTSWRRHPVSTIIKTDPSAPIFPTSMRPAHWCWTAGRKRRSTPLSITPANRRSSARIRHLYGWHCPPFFLFVAAPLALLPYLAALALWQGVTFGLYLASIWMIVSTSWPGLSRPSTPSFAATPKDDARNKPGHDGDKGGTSVNPIWLLLAAAYPAVFVNLGHGHNGFLTAALIGAALMLLDRSPAFAGILFGLMAYKPQFGLMIPLVLIATG